ncbi:hypothetical protein P280DRAFT_396604 [Massarina eburnea CBS 473.64]|uniref:Dynactin subunit 6 n=1 Tax=Massarina eburnea CBS 473.64 TaxID=1395130 RepID=A0A6A6S4F4_9PLEO|nr:hypothetical protein P280DRAFT_396604 [Massarina eburnea CBS 473.64]
MSAPTPSRSSSGRPTSTIQKRSSLLPKPSSIVIDQSVLIAQHASLTGTYPITVGPYTVLHPHSKISSTIAPVVLGEGVVVYERAKVGVGAGGVAGMGAARESMRVDGTVLGRYVVVETGAIVEAAEIGEGSVVEGSAVVGRGCVIGKFCTIAAHCIIPANTHLADYTVVYEGAKTRIDKTLQLRPQTQDMRTAFHKKQLETFRKLMPNNVAKWA